MLDWVNGGIATIFVLGLVVLVHEIGHFVVAKAFGVYSPRFSIGFGPALLSKRWGETEYVLAAFPLGGYVRMASREDEAMAGLEGGTEKPVDNPGGDPNAMAPFGPKPVPDNRLLESKSTLARVCILLAGVTMNMLLAFVVLVGLASQYGEQIVRTRVVGAVRDFSGASQLVGQISVGDTIIAIDGQPVVTWNDVMTLIESGSANPVIITTQRGNFSVPVGDSALLRRRTLALTIQPFLIPVIDKVIPGSPAERGGLLPGDSVVGVSGVPVQNWSQVVNEIERSPGLPLTFEVERDAVRRLLTIRPDSTPQPNPLTGQKEIVGKIGAWRRMVAERQRMRPARAVTAGWNATWSIAGSVVEVVKGLFTGAVSVKNLGGPIAIARASAEAAQSGFERVLELLAFLSVNLAVFNLLPIPILDGGQILLVLAEAARGRAFKTRTKEYILRAGLFAILLIFALVMFNDVTGLLGF